MACNSLYTYDDLLTFVLDFAGSGPSGDFDRSARQAIQLAYRDLANAHHWSMYYQSGLINTVAPYQTGTIAYIHTGGTYERQVTLTGGTWPSTAALATLKIGSATYEISARISDTILTLSISNNPGADVASTTYALVQDQYDLPADFINADTMHTRANWGGLQYVHPRDWKAERVLVATQSTPRFYTFLGSRHSLGTLALALYPAPDKVYSLEFVYQRRPRPLVIDKYQDGTITTTAASSTVTGSGTAWTQSHVGTVLRVGKDATDYPTGPFGANLGVFERSVIAVVDSATITVDSPITSSLAGVKYTLSDPVDIEDGAMLTAFLRGCEKQMSVARRMKDKSEAFAVYRDALLEAKAADVRTSIARGVGWEHSNRLQMKNFPLTADVG